MAATVTTQVSASPLCPRGRDDATKQAACLSTSAGSWYAAVGVSLTTTMAINVVVPHAALIIRFIMDPFRRFFGGRSAVTQVREEEVRREWTFRSYLHGMAVL